MVRFARRNGLKRLKCGEIEFEFSQPPQAKTRAAHRTPGEALGNDFKEPTEDEMLLWSTPSFDDVRSQREAASKERN